MTCAELRYLSFRDAPVLLAPRNDDDLPHRDPDRPFRDFDVVAARRVDGGDRKDSGLSARRAHLRHRRAGRAAHFHRTAAGAVGVTPAAAGMGRRRRRIVRLSRAVFSGAAVRATRGSRTSELSLAIADRIVLIVPARRTARGASRRRRAGGTCRHGASDRRRPVRLCPGATARTSRGVRRGVRLGDLFGDVAAAQVGADRCGRRLLSCHRTARRGDACVDRRHGVARDDRAMVCDPRARSGAGRSRVLYLGRRHEAWRYPRAGCGVLRDAVALHRLSDTGRLCQGERQYRPCRRADCGRRIDRRERLVSGTEAAISATSLAAPVRISRTRIQAPPCIQPASSRRCFPPPARHAPARSPAALRRLRGPARA